MIVLLSLLSASGFDAVLFPFGIGLSGTFGESAGGFDSGFSSVETRGFFSWTMVCSEDLRFLTWGVVLERCLSGGVVVCDC